MGFISRLLETSFSIIFTIPQIEQVVAEAVLLPDDGLRPQRLHRGQSGHWDPLAWEIPGLCGGPLHGAALHSQED